MQSTLEFERSQILVFDVNETLLDINALLPLFERAFGSTGALKQWFNQTLLYSQTMTLIGQYADFASIARRSLEMTAGVSAVQLGEDDVIAILSAMKSLPAHPDVPTGLRRLRQSGFRLIALTNSTQSVAEAQMLSAGLAQMFERVFSVDTIRKYKPHPEVYRHVAKELAVETGNLTMIAAHPWDLMGAKAAGCNIAFVERASTSWFHLAPKPTIAGPTLEEVAALLISSRADIQ